MLGHGQVQSAFVGLQLRDLLADGRQFAHFLVQFFHNQPHVAIFQLVE